MLSSQSYRNVYLFSIAAIFIVSCASEIPIQEMNRAKQEIGRAESLRAQEFAPEEWNEARRSLFIAHDKAAEENGSEAKKQAEYALSKAYDALERTLPRLAAQTRDEATAAIDAADDAFATGLAPNEFDKAILLRKEGDQAMERGDKALTEFLQEKSEEKKGELRQNAFREYESSYNNYLESKKTAEQARAIALGSKEELRKQARKVEEDLNKAETYMGGPNENVEKERNYLALAYQDIDNGELKKANEKIQTAQNNARLLLANSIQNYARERLRVATEVVEDSNARFENLSEADYQSSEELKRQYESARENLGAANEALASAGNLYSREKYEDSINESEEAIRLAEILLDQVSSIQSQIMARKADTGKETDESSIIEDNTKLTSSKPSKRKELNEGWSKYTVRKTKPEDCLWRIAERKEFYGNPKLWPRIYKANKDKIKNQDLIYPNQVLYIPPKTGPIGSPYRDTPSEEKTQKVKKTSTQPKSSQPQKSYRLNLKDEEGTTMNPQKNQYNDDEEDEDEDDDDDENEHGSP